MFYIGLLSFFHRFCFFFFFNDTATTEIYTLSLHDALPILAPRRRPWPAPGTGRPAAPRSEEHTSELQSRQYLVCRLLLEKKKKNKLNIHIKKNKNKKKNTTNQTKKIT